MNYNERMTELSQKDQELNDKYRQEFKETQDVQEYEKRMEVKTRRYRLEMYKILKN